jgi:hypothetical protein
MGSSDRGIYRGGAPTAVAMAEDLAADYSEEWDLR